MPSLVPLLGSLRLELLLVLGDKLLPVMVVSYQLPNRET